MRIKKLLPISVCLLLLAILLVPAGRALISRFSAGATAPLHETSAETRSAWDNLRNLLHENEELKAHNRELQEELLEFKANWRDREALQAENEQLRGLLKLPDVQGWKAISAQIVVRDPYTWNRRFRINRGRADGLKAGAAVAFEGFLIGRISKVYADTAEVVTVADPDCRVSVAVKELSIFGVLNGEQPGGWYSEPFCRLNYLERDARLTAGMIVETSGFGLTTPRGLAVGSLYRDHNGAVGTIVDNVYQRARVLPFAPIKDLRFVNVLIAQEQ